MAAAKPVDRSKFPRSVPHDRRFPFQVRRVDTSLRKYVHVDTQDLYADACLVADFLVRETGDDHVVWDTKEERVLYDSRQIKFA